MKRKQIDLNAGENLNRNPNELVVIIVDDGSPYLWIGNNAKGDKMCFATLSNRRSLKALANSIFSALRINPNEQ